MAGASLSAVPRGVSRASFVAATGLGLALVTAVANPVVWSEGVMGSGPSTATWDTLFIALACLQLLLGLGACAVFIVGIVRRPSAAGITLGVLGALLSFIVGAAGPVGLILNEALQNFPVFTGC